MNPQELRKSILQLAIEGKLVPQRPEEEGTADELFREIEGEKKRLIAAGTIKKEKPLPEIADEEKPFDIPENWRWVRLGEIATIFTGNSVNEREKAQKYVGLTEGYNYIGTKDVGFDRSINYANGVKIPFETTFRIARSGTPLLCIEGGSAGRKIGFLSEDVCFGNKLCAFETSCLNSRFLYYYLQSPNFVGVFQEKTTGIIGGVSINKLKGILFPLPPLAEQRRIVAKLEELLPLCERLK